MYVLHMDAVWSFVNEYILKALADWKWKIYLSNTAAWTDNMRFYGGFDTMWGFDNQFILKT